MKMFYRRRLLAAVLTFIMIFSVCGTGFVSAENGAPSGETIPAAEGYRLMAESDGKRLYLNDATTNFYVEDITTGKRVYAFPEDTEDDSIAGAAMKIEMQAAFVFTFWDPVKKTENKKNSNAAAVRQGSFTVREQENGFVIDYDLQSQQMKISLSVSLTDGKLFCSVPAGSIVENDSESVQLLRIAVLPYMISGKADTEGEIILPDGCGEVLDFGTTRAASASYQKPIYGRNLSTTLSVEEKNGYDITCPYLALCRDGLGVLSIPEKGAAVGYVSANPAGKSSTYANAYFSFDYRATDIAIIGDKQTMASQSTRVLDDQVYDGDITLSYQFLFENASAGKLAKLYGEYLAPGSLASAGQEHSAVFDVYGFVNEQKSFFGFPYTSVSVLSDAEDIISLANDESLKDITINLKNITKDQQKQRLNDDVKPISKVLSGSELKRLGDSDAYIYVNANPLTFRKNTLAANSFFTAAQTVYGAPIGLRTYRESTHMANKSISKSLVLKPAKILSTVEKLVSSAGKLGIDGMSSEQLGAMSYHDYSAEGTLADTHAVQEKAIATAAQSTGLILTNPYDYAIKYCSAVLDIPTDSSNNDMCSGSYPFIQIALGDGVDYSVEAINLYRSPETMLLNALTTGSVLHYGLILTDTEPITGTELNFLYSASYASFEDMIKKQYASWNEVNSSTGGSALADYERIGNTVTAVFENGATVTADLTQKTYSVTK